MDVFSFSDHDERTNGNHLYRVFGYRNDNNRTKGHGKEIRRFQGDVGDEMSQEINTSMS